MPSQHLPLGFHSSDVKWASCVQNLKLDDLNPNKVTLVPGTVSEAFIQPDIKKVKMGNLYL